MYWSFSRHIVHLHLHLIHIYIWFTHTYTCRFTYTLQNSTYIIYTNISWTSYLYLFVFISLQQTLRLHCFVLHKMQKWLIRWGFFTRRDGNDHISHLWKVRNIIFPSTWKGDMWLFSGGYIYNGLKPGSSVDWWNLLHWIGSLSHFYTSQVVIEIFNMDCSYRWWLKSCSAWSVVYPI